MCLGSLSCCITQVRLSSRSQTDSRTFFFAEFMVPLINYGNAASDHHTTSTMFDCWYDVFFYETLCWFYARYNRTQTFQKDQHLSHQSTEYLPKGLGDNQDFVFANVRRAFVFFLVRSRTAKMAEKLNSNFLLKYYHN